MTSIPLPSVTPHLFDYYLNHNEPFRINPIRFIVIFARFMTIQTPPGSFKHRHAAHPQLIVQGKLLQTFSPATDGAQLFFTPLNPPEDPVAVNQSRRATEAVRKID